MRLKVMLLAGGKKGTHTIRWANGLAKRGLEVHLVTQQHLYGEISERVIHHKLPFGGRIGYYANVLFLRALYLRIAPDVVNAHYASGYGTLARLARLRPLILSVWGSDVYDFPFESRLNLRMVKKNLRYADVVASTSKSMAEHVRTELGYSRPCVITPFGIDVDFFIPVDRASGSDSRRIVIGTVKTLSSKYGIDTLVRAFSLVDESLGHAYDLQLHIAGDGPDATKLKSLVRNLGISDKVVFHGFISKERVVQLLQEMDVYVALSRLDSESFGVALLEASACEIPLVVSDVSGPAEVVNNGVTGYVVPKDDAQAAAKKIAKLIEDMRLRKSMGTAGREHVVDNYSWSMSLDIMIELYEQVVQDNIK